MKPPPVHVSYSSDHESTPLFTILMPVQQKGETSSRMGVSLGKWQARASNPAIVVEMEPVFGVLPITVHLSRLSL